MLAVSVPHADDIRRQAGHPLDMDFHQIACLCLGGIFRFASLDAQSHFSAVAGIGIKAQHIDRGHSPHVRDKFDLDLNLRTVLQLENVNAVCGIQDIVVIVFFRFNVVHNFRTVLQYIGTANLHAVVSGLQLLEIQVRAVVRVPDGSADAGLHRNNPVFGRQGLSAGGSAAVFTVFRLALAVVVVCLAVPGVHGGRGVRPHLAQLFRVHRQGAVVVHCDGVVALLDLGLRGQVSHCHRDAARLALAGGAGAGDRLRRNHMAVIHLDPVKLNVHLSGNAVQHLVGHRRRGFLEQLDDFVLHKVQESLALDLGHHRFIVIDLPAEGSEQLISQIVAQILHRQVLDVLDQLLDGFLE